MTKKIYSITSRHIRNATGIVEAVFKKRLKNLDKTKYLGFFQEKLYTTKKGKIIIEIDLITGTPTEKFRKLIKKAGLIGTKFS